MRRILTAVLAVWFIALLEQPAQAYPTWSLERAALTATAKAQTWEGTGVTAFVPDVTGTYSLTSGLTLAGSFGRDFVGDLNSGSADAVFKVAGGYEQGWQAGISVGVIGYSGEGREALGIVEDTSMRYGLRGSWSAWRDGRGATRLYGIAQAHFDPNQNGEDGLWTFGAGLRFTLIGGRPDRAVYGPQ